MIEGWQINTAPIVCVDVNNLCTTVGGRCGSSTDGKCVTMPATNTRLICDDPSTAVCDGQIRGA